MGFPIGDSDRVRQSTDVPYSHIRIHLTGACNLQAGAAMDILFETEKLAKLCSQERLMSKIWDRAIISSRFASDLQAIFDFSSIANSST
jgi:hypothetical protein